MSPLHQLSQNLQAKNLENSIGTLLMFLGVITSHTTEMYPAIFICSQTHRNETGDLNPTSHMDTSSTISGIRQSSWVDDRPFPFLLLPAELRLGVYDTCENAIIATLLRLCSFVHKEVTEILWGRTWFSIGLKFGEYLSSASSPSCLGEAYRLSNTAYPCNRIPFCLKSVRMIQNLRVQLDTSLVDLPAEDASDPVLRIQQWVLSVFPALKRVEFCDTDQTVGAKFSTRYANVGGKELARSHILNHFPSRIVVGWCQTPERGRHFASKRYCCHRPNCPRYKAMILGARKVVLEEASKQNGIIVAQLEDMLSRRDPNWRRKFPRQRQMHDLPESIESVTEHLKTRITYFGGLMISTREEIESLKRSQKPYSQEHMQQLEKEEQKCKTGFEKSKVRLAIYSPKFRVSRLLPKRKE
jgi:hypothetical protein